jgi:hypothetical protein
VIYPTGNAVDAHPAPSLLHPPFHSESLTSYINLSFSSVIRPPYNRWWALISQHCSTVYRISVRYLVIQWTIERFGVRVGVETFAEMEEVCILLLGETEAPGSIIGNCS